MKQKILAITPLFGKSGSEISLLNLMESSKKDFDVTIFTPNKHPELQKEIPEGINLVFPMDKGNEQNSFIRLVRKLRSIGVKKALFPKTLKHQLYDVIILNTLLSISYYPIARERGRKIILYIHETELMLEKFNAGNLKQILNEVDLVLCSSNYVKQYLQIWGRKENIEVLYPSIKLEKFALPLPYRTIRKTMGIDDSDFVWGMTGAINNNKNPRMFVEAAQRLSAKHEKVKFIWIGARQNNAYEDYLHHYIQFIGMEKKIIILERKDEDYFRFLNSIDGFLLTSFSESFSIAAFEASGFAKPVVTFPNGGVLEAVPESLRKTTREFSVDELVTLMNEVMQEAQTKIEPRVVDQLYKMDSEVVYKYFLRILGKRDS